MSLYEPVNVDRWIEEHRAEMVPPVSNKQIWKDERETIIFVSVGPNTRNDYHVNPTEEFFYQLKGDVCLRIRHPDTDKPHDIMIREHDAYLLPAWIPHRPMRPEGTIGMIVELKRPEGANDALRWYCESCDALVHEASWRLEHIDRDLHEIMQRFWSDDERRTCPSCGTRIEAASEAVPVG